MNKRSLFILGLLVISGSAIIVYMVGPGKTLAPTTRTMPATQQQVVISSSTPPSNSFASIPDLILIASPASGSVITSPVTVKGAARGNWFFEGSAPVELQDAKGKTIAQGTAKPDSDAQTTEFVHFTATLTFTKPASATGKIILKNDNPSGDPDKQKTLTLPVTF